MKLVYWPSDVLKTLSVPIETGADLTPELIADLTKVLVESGGVGLSAIQVGIAKAVFLLRLDGNVEAYVNPAIVCRSEDQAARLEGCLSAPGCFVSLSRPAEVVLKYQKPWAQPEEQYKDHPFIELVATGIRAQAIQHEMEHLQGKFFLDRLPAAERQRVRGNMQKLRRTGKLK